LFGNAPDKFLFAAGIVELYLIQLHASGDEMDMRIIETGQEQFS